MPHDPSDAAVTDFIQAMTLLIRRARSETASHRFSLAEAGVMARLAAGGPATTASLARAESMKPQSMGAILGGLEGAGIVRRKPHPTDGRRLNIELTAKGAAMRKDAEAARRAWLVSALGKIDVRDQKTLFAATDIIRRLAEQ